jgi:ABC-type dipeptide/oligopeptide/nickel transport system permease component
MVKKKVTSKSSKKKTQSKKRPIKKRQLAESDSHFFLKSVVFLILGSQWVFIQTSPDMQIPIPVGLIVGLVFATHEHFQIDRKIEYVILLFSAFISFWLPIGLVIQL